MPVLLSLDTETSGLLFDRDRVLEFGGVLYSTGLKRSLESVGFLIKQDVEITPEITEITGITKAALDKFGYDSESALESVIGLMEQSDYIVGHNVQGFDKKMIEAWAKLHSKKLPEKLWLDSCLDIPGVEKKKLAYLAADHGLLNFFPHSALADAQMVVKVISSYNIDTIVARAKMPWVVLKADVSFHTNALAKKRKYRWYATDKLWWLAVKESEVEAEIAAASQAGFKSSIIKNPSFEELTAN